MKASSTRYASYTVDDPYYLVDLERDFSRSATAWWAYRDAYCQAEPLMQGMARGEQEALAASCRMELTRARIIQLRRLAKAF